MSSASDPAADLVNHAAAALDEGTFIALTLSRPSGEQVKQTVRPVQIKGQPLLQWTLHHRQQRHENHDAAGSVAALRDRIGQFGGAHLFTRSADWTLQRSRRGEVRLKRSKPSKQIAEPSPHDRQKSRLLPDDRPVPFAVAAGLQRADGRVPKAKRAKYRQLNRFLELIDDVLGELPSEAERDGRPLHVVEFGSGQSYLSFAVRYLLADLRGQPVTVRAIDREASVIESARQRAGELGITDMRFETATIDQIELHPPVDLAIWLHACDTATDDAIAKSVAAGASVILAVPCCQHEINAAMKPGDDLLASHGLHRERYAAMATDALRANWLDRRGYRCQIVEFIDMQHTAKNVLLRASRRTQPLAETQRAELKAAADDLKERLGIADWHLERIAG